MDNGPLTFISCPYDVTFTTLWYAILILSFKIIIKWLFCYILDMSSKAYSLRYKFTSPDNITFCNICFIRLELSNVGTGIYY